jgi:hypothetical protein
VSLAQANAVAGELLAGPMSLAAIGPVPPSVGAMS